MQTLLPSLRILDGQKKSHSQQASAEQNLLQEPVKAKKRTAKLSELEAEAEEASQEAGGKKAAKKRRVTFAEQREEPLQNLGEPAGQYLCAQAVLLLRAKFCAPSLEHMTVISQCRKIQFWKLRAS